MPSSPLPRQSDQLREFVIESNRIEGIRRDPTDYELLAHAAFLPLQKVTVADMESFVREVAARPLRDVAGRNVRIGNHLPPPGGPLIRESLAAILNDANHDASPWEVHRDYELLHPFMDGNGRSGRVLWAWQMRRQGLDPFALPFLHRWYYQSLDAARSE